MEEICFGFLLMLDFGFEMVLFLSLGNLLVYFVFFVYLNDLNFFINGFFLFVDEGIGVDF